MKTSPTSALNSFPQPPPATPYWHWEHHPDVVQPLNGRYYLYLGECLQTEMRSSPAAGRRVPAAPRDEY